MIVFDTPAPAGTVVSQFFEDAGDPRPGDGRKVVGGPYPDLEHANARARPELLYPHLLRCAIKSGFLRAIGGHTKVSLPMVAEWTGYSVDTLQSWLRPMTSVGHRPMPRSAIRLIIHELKLRDQSTYPWDRILKLCQ